MAHTTKSKQAQGDVKKMSEKKSNLCGRKNEMNCFNNSSYNIVRTFSYKKNRGKTK